MESPIWNVERMFTGPMKKYWRSRYRLFSRYDEGIILTKELWFSVTPEDIAMFIAKFISTAFKGNCHSILDLFCGGGGNTIQFLRYFERVYGLDSNPMHLQCSLNNANVYFDEEIIRDHLNLIECEWGGADTGEADEASGLVNRSGSNDFEVGGQIRNDGDIHDGDEEDSDEEDSDEENSNEEDSGKEDSDKENSESSSEDSDISTSSSSVSDSSSTSSSADNYTKTVDYLKEQHIDVIFASPPWGGPSYLKSEKYDLNRLLPLDLGSLLRSLRVISDRIVLFLPRNSDLEQIQAISEEVFGDCKVRVLRLSTSGFTKGLICCWGEEFEGVDLEEMKLS
ncbi:DEKNAAC105385 [Brettanomyces naardenensis]|uniref:Trimethylguanosine synthase n=1 Tax=Brettanomyces naardenensis TaxID=13370 RepID=A0A448YT50_BRENA|nr:DEKNAAC105385 [Brettanomyces naardenensis]